MRTFQSKLMLFLVLVTLFPVMIMGTYAYHISVKTVRANAMQGMQAALEQIGHNVDFQMTLYKKYMDFMVASDELKKVLFGNDFDKTKVETRNAYQELDTIMNRLFFEERLIGHVEFYRDHELLHSYSGTGGVSGSGIGNSAIYDRAMDQHGKVYMEKLPSADNSDGGYYVLGRRLYDNMDRHEDDSYSAGVFLFVRETNFSAIIRESNSYTRGVMTISTLDGTPLARTGGLGLARSELITNETLGNSAGPSVGQRSVSLEGESYMVGYYRLPQWNIQIVQVLPQSEVTGGIATIARSTYLLCVVLLIILLTASWVFARKFARPVKTMVHAMRQIQAGKFNIQVATNFDNEFAVMAGSFNFMAARLKEVVGRLVEEEKRRGDTEFQMLQYQINPHFLNNALGSIRLQALTRGESVLADMIYTLARIYQRTLGNGKRLIRLRTELANLKDYIKIQQMQYANALHVYFDVEDELLELYIPGLLMQPLVENAIFHGLNTAEDNPTLRIGARREGKQLLLSVSDNGVGMTAARIREVLAEDTNMADRLSKIGVRNVDQRIKLLYGENYGIALQSEEGVGTEAVIRLPAMENEGRSLA
ncbi:MAG: hypothetical protein K0Q63_830 [Paenibacillus sp.]|jgi:sensor histidine kinase YesM|nr:hypothetical protein [Paenibacillus sp.]